MNKNKLNILIIGVFVLAVMYGLLSFQGTRPVDLEKAKLFSDIPSGDVSRIKVEQGSQSLELELKDGLWTLPGRGNYPADSGKIVALLLKVFDLSVTQKVPIAEETVDKLGLSDEAVQRGHTRLTFFDNSGKELAGLRIGETRKGPNDKPSAPFSLGGQYIKRSDQAVAYVVPLPITVSPSISYWLDQNILNVLQSSLRALSQTKNDKTEFQLKSADGDKLKFVGDVPAGHTLSDNAVNDIATGLENLRLEDVFRADAAEVKDLKFDLASIFLAKNALRYKVESAEKDAKFYFKLSVAFDEQAAAEEKQIFEASKPTPNPNETPTPAEQAETKSAAPELSNIDEAKKLQDRLGSWIFQIPSFQAKKFRKTTSDLFVESKASSNSQEAN